MTDSIQEHNNWKIVFERLATLEAHVFPPAPETCFCGGNDQLGHIAMKGHTTHHPKPDAVDTRKFLDWIADRLVHVYKESENVDFVLKLRRLARTGGGE